MGDFLSVICPIVFARKITENWCVEALVIYFKLCRHLLHRDSCNIGVSWLITIGGGDRPRFRCHYSASQTPQVFHFLSLHHPNNRLENTRWFKYDRDKLWLVYTHIVPVIFEPPCISILLFALLQDKNKTKKQKLILGIKNIGRPFAPPPPNYACVIKHGDRIGFWYTDMNACL
jgi:hypothetical protein